jgi:hypothetical protein
VVAVDRLPHLPAARDHRDGANGSGGDGGSDRDRSSGDWDAND